MCAFRMVSHQQKSQKVKRNPNRWAFRFPDSFVHIFCSIVCDMCNKLPMLSLILLNLKKRVDFSKQFWNLESAYIANNFVTRMIKIICQKCWVLPHCASVEASMHECWVLPHCASVKASMHEWPTVHQ